MANRKKQYHLDGLCCSNCAAKIQKDIQLLQGVKSAEVNVDTAVLSLESDMDSEVLLKEITRVATSHEEDIIVKEA